MRKINYQKIKGAKQLLLSESTGENIVQTDLGCVLAIVTIHIIERGKKKATRSRASS
jgi:hypothetical protein